MLNGLYRELPADVELEQAVIGAALVRNTAMDDLATVTPEDFSEGYHAALWDAMQHQWRETGAVNLATLRGICADLPDVADGVTPAEYIRRLVAHGDTRNVKALGVILKEWANRRRLCMLASDLDATVRHPGQSVQHAASAAVAALDEVLSYARTGGDSRVSTAAAMTDAVYALDEDTSAGRITTGMSDLDRVTGGWRRKQFAILAGRPSMGKTAVATSAMIRTALAGHGVLMFSLEMATRDLAYRMMCDLAWSPDDRIAYADAMAGRLHDVEKAKLGRIAASYTQLPLVIDDQRGLTMAEIAARTRAEAQRMERNGQKLGLVVVDHLGLVKPSGRYAGNKVQEVGEISDALATLAKDQDIAVLALHQLNRGTEGRENKRPGLADLRNSGDLEQDADVVCFAYREAYYLERTKCEPGSDAELMRQRALEDFRHTLEILVAKNRNGATTSVPLFCDMASNVVRDAG